MGERAAGAEDTSLPRAGGRGSLRRSSSTRGGYRSSYWHDQALAHGAAKADKLKIAETNLRAVVESGNPDALFGVGMLPTDGRYLSNPLNGIAVALAACNLGRDCSANNPENAFSNCKVSGACPANTDYAYLMQQSLGPDKDAQVYARAQQVQQSIESGDWDAVLANLKIDRHP